MWLFCFGLLSGVLILESVLLQERTDLLAKIASSRSVEEKVLQKNLLEHITLHVEHLQSVYREKQAACGGGC